MTIMCMNIDPSSNPTTSADIGPTSTPSSLMPPPMYMPGVGPPIVTACLNRPDYPTVPILTGNTTGVFVRQAATDGAVPQASDVLTKRLNAQPKDTLHPGNYYYFIKENNTYHADYKILKDFRSWTMPPQLPDYWEFQWVGPPTEHESTDFYLNLCGLKPNAAYVKSYDRRCLVIGIKSCLHASHLVPHSELKWFTANIKRIPDIGGVNTLDGAQNLITLRADLNSQSFDKGEDDAMDEDPTPQGSKNVAAVDDDSSSSSSSSSSCPTPDEAPSPYQQLILQGQPMALAEKMRKWHQAADVVQALDAEVVPVLDVASQLSS
ncbi:hypothetical protein B0H16DRAFT_1726420 [Mycena metata]|uniref:HNH nuclease domain-containing protein n=1 Tax=Mycena metata TaxID=1033252 RepID=A0AAD7IPS8_9AGAR|nr:hypothetical protein B0H16DRAFT_1726420 [Mycena metata]